MQFRFVQLHLNNYTILGVVKDCLPMDRTIHCSVKILIEQVLKKSLLVANSQTGLTIPHKTIKITLMMSPSTERIL